MGNRYLHTWYPSLVDNHGGIQFFSNSLMASLEQSQLFSQVDIYSKNDCSNSARPLATTNFIHRFGRYPQRLRTLAFTLSVGVRLLFQRPDLILSAHLNFGPLAYFLKRWHKSPYWLMAYGIDAWDLTDPKICQALKAADRILTISHYTRDRLLQEQSLNPDNVVILPCTFDHERFTIASKPANLLSKYGLSHDQPVILTTARLSSAEQYKGYDTVLMAMPQLIKTIPNVHYVLVGKGSDRPRIEALIQQLKIADHVTLTGYVPDDELAAHYQLCDVFAMPSKGEGFGIVYLEALACGKPTLGGNQDGAIDALCEGRLGALVDPDNIDEISHTLIQILQGDYPNRLMYQPEKLRQEVINVFGFEKFQQTLQHYLEDFFTTAQP